jgi:hypothetical protein
VDSDGFGATNYTMEGCEQPSGYVATADDCDDLNAAINPAAQEVCDGDVDNDCDGVADDADDSVDSVTFSTYYIDTDADGYGDSTAATLTQCTMPSGYANMGDDCDDVEALVNPGETEVCNDGLDNDCSGDAPECALPAFGGPSDAVASVVGGNGAESFGQTGMVLGDFDGDGNTDLAVADYYGDSSTGTYDAGTVDFYYGPLSTTGITSQGGYEGANSSDLLGYGMANVGDWTGDGADELIIGAPGFDSQYNSAGTIYLVSGTTSVLEADSNNLGSMEGEGTYNYFGRVVTNVGDVDGSGDNATAMGGYGTSLNYYGGMLWVGNSTGTVNNVIYGSYYEYLGYNDRVASAGDMDGDGYDDWVAAGCYSTSCSSAVYSYGGNIYAFYGGSSNAWTSTQDADATISGTSSSQYLGYTLAGGSDIDGDGYDDFSATDNSGINVYSGGTTRLTGASTPSITVSDSPNTSSYTYYRSTEQSMGDLNNDGVGDLVAADYYGASYAGGVWTFYGPMSAGSYDVIDADSSLVGNGTYTYFGKSNLAGDITGDGIDDLLIGSDGDEAVYIFTGGGM